MKKNNFVKEIIEKFSKEEKSLWIHNGPREEIDNLTLALKEILESKMNKKVDVKYIYNQSSLEKTILDLEPDRKNFNKNKVSICCDYLSFITGQRNIPYQLEDSFYKINVRAQFIF